MQTLNTILNIVLIVLSIAMIAVVLMQQSKSAGLGSAFGGDTQSFTARSREAKLQRITKILAVAIGVIAIAMAIIS